jgi:D-threo-aldose 1-dehydrogenase
VERVALGRTAVQVTRLGLGCAPLGNMFTALGDEQAGAAVDAAGDVGIRWLDAAPLYGHGLSEHRLGAPLRPRRRADCVGHRQATAGSRPRSCDIFAETPPVRPLFGSLMTALLSQRASEVGIDNVDVLHVHGRTTTKPRRSAARSAPTATAGRGVVGAIGAGMNQSAMLTRFVERGLVDCVLLAGRYSILDQSGSADLLPAAMKAGVAVIAAGVFNSGLLADPKAGATFDYAPASPERIERAKRLRQICVEHGVSLRAAALQFPTHHPAVVTVLSGARSAAEIDDNARMFAQPIPRELWAALRVEGLISEEL